MARNKKVEILSNDKEVLHPMTDGDCVIFEDGQTLAQKLSEDDSVKYTPEIVNSSPMFKVGEGNTVDYSDNVLDGAYERATLQGQTYVNYIQESSADEVTLPTPFTEYERTQHNTLTSDEEGTLGINLVGQSYVNALQHDSEEEYVVLGESLEFQEKKVEYTNEGQIKSAMLKGQTLVNVFKSFANYTYSASEMGIKWVIGGSAPLTETLNNNELTMTLTGVGSKVVIIHDVSMLKPNTQYMVKINYTTSFGSGINFGYHTELGNYIEIANMKSNEYVIFTTPSDLSTWIALWFGRLDNLQTGDTIKISKPVLLEYQQGMENWDIPYFEGMQSVTVSTRLENKLGTCTVGSIAQYAKNGKTFTITDIDARQCILYSVIQATTNPINLKPNTKYLIHFKISDLVLDGLSSIGLVFSSGVTSGGDCLFGEKTETFISANGVYNLVFTTTDLITSSAFVIKGLTKQWENSGSSLRSLTISNIMCVEYQNGMENWDLPYFEDYQVMKPVQVESVNKNLQPNETYVTNSANNVSIIEGDKGLIRVNATKRYKVSAGAEIKGCTMKWYDKNKNYIVEADTNGLYPITNPNAYYARLHISIDTNYLNTIQVEESDTGIATEYVPHQSKTTYSWDEVILRKIGDVEDTLDLTTGEWVQRIGEIKLIDQTKIVSGSRTSETWFEALVYLDDYIKVTNNDITQIINNKLPLIWDASLATTSYIRNASTNRYIIIGLTVEDMGGLTGYDGWNYYVKNNDVVIQYVLETPIVHKVNLSRPNLQVYDDITHVHTKCLDGTLIPNIYLPSDISYPAILEPSTTYNVCVNHTEVSADNPLTVNVGGTELVMTDSRMTLTTPTTLAHSNVLFMGKGNKIKESMLIKNSSLITGDLPHFNGIGSVQLGKTIENLCSSKYIKGGSAQATLTDALDTVKITITTQGSYVLEFPILTPLENGKTYFVYAPVSGGWATYSFVRTYDNSKSYLRQTMGDMMNPQQYIVTIDQLDNQYASLCIGCHGAISVGTTYTITRPILCEYEPGMEDWDWESIGYFTGTKNIGNEFMRVQNKNLFDGQLVDGYIDTNNGSRLEWPSHFNSKNFIRVYPGLSYKLPKPSIIANDQVYALFEYDKNKRYIGYVYLYDNTITYIPQENVSYIIISGAKNNQTLQALSNSIQVEESSTATTYTAHKHNGLYITKDQPINLTWEQGRINPSGIGDSYTNAINNTVSYGIRTKGLLNLKPNTTYRISLGDKANFKYHIAVFDNLDNALSASSSLSLSGDWVSNKDTIFTTTKDAHKIGINVQKHDAGSITPSESVHAQVRLEEVTDVVLKRIGDVHDELDITRGIYTQRIGEYIFDGSKDEGWQIRQGTEGGYNYFLTYTLQNNSTSVDIPILCDQLPPIGYNDMDLGIKAIGINFSYEMRLNFKDCDSNNGATVEQLKQKLSNNPITVYYALETPIIHKVHIGNKNEANTEVTKPNDVFTLPTLYTEQTHIDLTNNGIIPKVQSRDYIAYPVSPMINRTYTLQHNLTGGVSNLTVDLLGRTQSVSYQNHKSLVYTPETMDAILHNELRISGKGKISKVMYIDGGYMDRDIPYIQGMKNGVNPIVKNVGKNLFDLSYISNYENWTKDSVDTSFNNYPYIRIKLKPNTNYVFTRNSANNPSATGTMNHTVVHALERKNDVNWMYHHEYPSLNNKTVYIRTSNSGVLILAISTCTDQNILTNMMQGFSEAIIEESSTPSQYEPYKENICYVDCGEIKLTPDMFEQGSINNSGGSYESDKNTAKNRISTKELIELEPSVQYVVLGDDSVYKYSAHFYDKDGMQIKGNGSYDLAWKANKPFTIPSDAPMTAFFVAYQDNRNFTVDDADFNFQLVKVSEIKQMRSLPHGVQDEIDLETGKYIQRVGEITFNGTENWQPGYTSWDNKYTYYNNSFVDLKTMKGDNGSGQAYYDAVRCPQLHRSYMSRLASALIDGVCSYYYSGYQRIFVSKQDCATVEELKLWLQENPITVQYELPEPIVKDIIIHNYPHSYEGGHVIIENGDPNTPITAQLTYRAVTNRSGQIQQHTEQVEKQEREINELETLILANIHLSQTR
jgi:hypothetical protein